jgi:hypothetical protein
MNLCFVLDKPTTAPTVKSTSTEQNNQEIFNFLNDCLITNLAKQQQQQTNSNTRSATSQNSLNKSTESTNTSQSKLQQETVTSKRKNIEHKSKEPLSNFE